jgi:HEAT repeat protein
MAASSGSYVFVAIVAAAGACSRAEPAPTDQASHPPAAAEAPAPVPLDTALARLRAESPAVRVAGAYALAIPGPRMEERLQALGRALRDADSAVGHAAASSLGNLGRPSLPILITALSDRRAAVRTRALYGLGKMGQAAAAARDAVRGAMNDPDRSVSNMASWTMGQIGPRVAAAKLGSTADLAAGLAAADPEERLSAVRRFQPFVGDSDQSISLLVRTLGDADPRVRSAAGDALVKLGSPATRTALTAALSDSSPVVRREASVALVRLRSLR